MPAQTTTASPPPAGDDLDDLFNYDVETDDVFRDYNPAMDAPVRSTSPARAKVTDLGIDEEIQVARKRKPIAKLDENRLLSQAGIPKLRRITKERLKFKGKGHEYSDVARLLNLYQLWLDDLYPRAKFADGLTIIEKLGHTKRLQIMRREWIREGKPLGRSEEEALNSKILSKRTTNIGKVTSSEEHPTDPHMSGISNTATVSLGNNTGTSKFRSSKEESLFVSDDDADLHPSDDELDALLAEDAPNTISTPAVNAPFLRAHDEPSFHPPEDELDALLNEDTFYATSTAPVNTASLLKTHDEFEDEMEAMAGMDDMW